MHRIQTLNHRFASDTVVTPEWLNSLQEEIANVVEYAGLTLNTSKMDLATQLWMAINLIKGKQEYDYVVSTQEEFNYLIERQGANHYHIKDDYKSVYFKYKASGYLCYGTTSFLQTSDTWGYIQTNLCTHLVFEEGAYFNSGTNTFYVEVNTDDCRLDNVYIKGDTSGAGAITEGFVLRANRVTYHNCKVSDRLSNKLMYGGFEGSPTREHNLTSKYINCSVWGMRNSTATKDLNGFYLCYNLNNCNVYDFDTTGGGNNIIGFYSCYNVSNCSVWDFDIGTVNSTGFYGCYNITSCYAYDFQSTTGSNRGFYACQNMSSCYANQFDASGAGTTFGFLSCSYMSACQSNDMDSVGGIDNGFRACSYGSAIYTSEAANSGNDWMDSNDASIANQYSCPAVFT